MEGPYEGKHLNNPDSYPINDINDERLDFLLLTSTSFKLMDTSKKGKRIRRLTGGTSNAWHVTLNGLIDLVKSLLGLGVEYICLGKLQSDRLESEFWSIRQMSGGCYLISVDQIISSLSLRRLKLYSKLGLENVIDTNKNLDDRDEDLELLDSCSGYVAFKESLTFPDGVVVISDHGAGEFTEMISRGKLTDPPSKLYDLSLSLYSFFKHRKMKCCSKIFRDAYKYIYECSGYDFPNINSILSRFNICFVKAYAKNETDKIKSGKADKKERKTRKLNS